LRRHYIFAGCAHGAGSPDYNLAAVALANGILKLLHGCRLHNGAATAHVHEVVLLLFLDDFVDSIALDLF
jgi:hypothetical protein